MAIDSAQDTPPAAQAFDGVLDTLSTGLLVIDADGVVRFANAAAASLLGRDDLIGRTLGLPIGERGRTLLEVAGEEHRTLELTVTPTSWGHETGVVVDLHDVTDRAQRIDELSQALDASQLTLAAVTHELRTPLAFLSSAVDLLAEGGDRASGEQDLLERCRRQIRRMHLLIENVLARARAEAGQLSASGEVVAVAEAIGEAVHSALLDQEERARVLCPDELRTVVERTHLLLILENLLINAVKYGAPPYEVSASREGDTVEIAVRDHGDGVAEAFQPHLFDRFQRAASTSGQRGTGLGLAIARTLARLNGGELTYTGDAPGACFVLRLPVPGPARGREGTT